MPHHFSLTHAHTRTHTRSHKTYKVPEGPDGNKELERIKISDFLFPLLSLSLSLSLSQLLSYSQLLSQTVQKSPTQSVPYILLGQRHDTLLRWNSLATGKGRVNKEARAIVGEGESNGRNGDWRGAILWREIKKGTRRGLKDLATIEYDERGNYGDLRCDEGDRWGMYLMLHTFIQYGCRYTGRARRNQEAIFLSGVEWFYYILSHLLRHLKIFTIQLSSLEDK